MTTKPDEIRIQKPDETRGGGSSVAVSFRRGCWTNFKRRTFRAPAVADAIRLARDFAEQLSSTADWALASREPRRPRRGPVVPRRINGGSVFFSQSSGRWVSSLYVGRDAKGKRILQVFKCDSEADARGKMDRFIREHNATIA